MFLKSPFLIFAGIATALFSLSTHVASAKTVTCVFGPQIEELAALEKIGTGGKTPKTEIAVRKSILANVIDCASEEAKALRGIINALSFSSNDLDIKAVHTDFLAQLDKALAYYETRKKKIDGLTIEETKALSKDILEWRTTIYIPSLEKIANFIMWSKNQDLIKTTEGRLGQIEQTIRTLSLQDNKDIAELIARSKNNLQNAQSSSRRARQLFLIENPPNDFSYLFKASLDGLSQTYQSFFTLSQAVNRIIPQY